MRNALPQMLEIAALLMAHESDVEPAANAGTAKGAIICEKLRPMLSTLMGATGFHTLLTRALVLASADVPALRALTVDTSGSLVQANSSLDPAAALHGTEAGVTLVAQLLSLLVAFIGETLTLQLLADIWPRVLHHDPNFRTGDRK